MLKELLKQKIEEFRPRTTRLMEQVGTHVDRCVLYVFLAKFWEGSLKIGKFTP